VWEDHRVFAKEDVYWKVLDSFGNTLVEDTPVAAKPNKFDSWPVLAVDDENHLHLAWSQADQDNIDGEIFLKKYTNGPPSITSTPITRFVVDRAYFYQVEATDPDPDPLRYSIVEGPEGLRIDPETGLVAWLPGQPRVKFFKDLSELPTSPGGNSSAEDSRGQGGLPKRKDDPEQEVPGFPVILQVSDGFRTDTQFFRLRPAD